MARVERTIVIQAPEERVFGYVADPSHLPELIPSMTEVKDIQLLANGGHRFCWVYKMAGVRFEGTTETTEHTPNQRLVAKFTGGIESTVTWTFQPQMGGTHVDFFADYTVPAPLLGRLAEAIVVKVNEREVETMLANLKFRMES